MKDNDNRTTQRRFFENLTVAITILFAGMIFTKLWGCVPNKTAAEPREESEKATGRESKETHDQGNNNGANATNPNEKTGEKDEVVCKLPEGREPLELAEWSAPDGCIPRPYGGFLKITDEESFQKWFICRKPRESGVDFEKYRIVVFLASRNPHTSVMGLTKDPEKNEIVIHILDPVYCGRANPEMIRFRIFYKVPVDTPPVTVKTCRPRTKCTGAEHDTRP